MKTRLEKELFKTDEVHIEFSNFVFFVTLLRKNYLPEDLKQKQRHLSKTKLKPVLFISARLRDSPKNRCGMRKSKQKKHN